MSKKSTFVVDKDNVVHFRFCTMGQPYYAQTVIEEKPFLVETKTAEQMLANIARGDSRNQYGEERQAPSMLTACPDCIVSDETMMENM